MKRKFTNSEWEKINSLFAVSAHNYGLPLQEETSIILGSFNIRKLGSISSRNNNSWHFLKKTIQHFDLLAIQEVMDDLSGLEYLHSLLGSKYDIVVSDITGAFPGKRGNAERLAFLFNSNKVKRTALASDISFDRTEVINRLYNHRTSFNKEWLRYTNELKLWKKTVAERERIGKKSPAKPSIHPPEFVTFIRQPHCVSFEIKAPKSSKPYQFLVVNAHLLYGKNKHEREWEFKALLEWLTTRAKYIDKLYHPNILLLGDCNLDFDTVPEMRVKIDHFLKGLNTSVLKSKKAAIANFPLLTKHPKYGLIRTALRQTQTYDQIGIFSNDPRLPKPEHNTSAGTSDVSFDYGVFNIANLISQSLYGKNIDDITATQRSSIYKKSEYDLSDHMPIWLKLPLL